MRVLRPANAMLRAFCALLLALPLVATADEEPGPGRAFVGVWVLDNEASDEAEPLLELLDTPWLARKMAGSVTPTLTIRLRGDGGLNVLNENPLHTDDRVLVPDGVWRQEEDPLGRKVVSSELWNEAGQLILWQKNYIDAGRVVEITSTWARVGDHLEFTNRTEAGDTPLAIRRVFRRIH